MARQPAMNGGRLVRAGVVENEVDFERGRDPRVERIEELPELPRALPPVKLADDLARLGVERGNERRRPVPKMNGRRPRRLRQEIGDPDTR
jgi:hypothetical protein